MGVWLASASERRSKILEEMVKTLHVEALSDVDETPPNGDISHQVLSICRRKAEAVPDYHAHEIVVVADTMVADPDDTMLAMGKPDDKLRALSMLKRLSGRRHQVWSATGIQICGDWTFFVEYATVEVEDLSEDILKMLIDTDSWIGKAGGYDLAGEMGNYASIIEGEEITVLGFASSALRLIH
ncbi:MAG: Maf family protein [Candidatus Poseidoniaceae archaeon]|jgi:septum formation protein|nr:Maf family protein [Candidatus Poseidoniaceae archaeon]